MASNSVQSPQQAQFIAAALLASPVILALVGTGLTFSGGVGIEMDFPLVAHVALGMVGAMALLASIMLRRIFLKTMPGHAPLQQRMGITITCMGIAEAPAAIGLVVVILSGDLVSAGVLWGLGFAGMVHHFPSRAWLEAGGQPPE